MKKKRVVFVLAVALLCLSLYVYKERMLLYVITELIDIRYKLVSLYLDHTNFTFANDDEQLRKGYTEKYVLQDGNGNKWLFKVESNERLMVSTLMAYRLAYLSGLNAYPAYEFHLPVNGQILKGFIMEMLPQGTKFFKTIDENIIRDQNYLKDSIINAVFNDWLVLEFTAAIEFALTSSGRLYQIDLNDFFTIP